MSECGACCVEEAQDEHTCPLEYSGGTKTCTCCMYCEYKCEHVYEDDDDD